MSRTQAVPVGDRVRRPVWGHWPSAVGATVAVSQIVAGVDVEGTAITVTAAASCYLAAAALGRRWVAWVGVFVSAAAVVLSELAGIPWWLGLATYAAGLLALGLGLGRGRSTPARHLSDQALAMLLFGGLAVGALVLAPRLGLALAGAVLAAHALWDLRHWRRDDVVPRSMAEFCFLLDVPLGAAAIYLAVSG